MEICCQLYIHPKQVEPNNVEDRRWQSSDLPTCAIHPLTSPTQSTETKTMRTDTQNSASPEQNPHVLSELKQANSKRKSSSSNRNTSSEIVRQSETPNTDSEAIKQKNAGSLLSRRFYLYGGAAGNRTPDLVIANDALSQLSYSPVTRILTVQMVMLNMCLIRCGTASD